MTTSLTGSESGSEAGGARGGLLMVGVLLAFAAISWKVFNQIEEDAFIYFRFAARFVEGHGLTFNAGGIPVESSSNLSWQFLVVLLTLLPVDIVIAAKLCGITLGMGALWLTYTLAKRLTNDPTLSATAALLLAISIPFYQWSQRALGTPLYLCTLLTFAWFVCTPRLRKWWFLPAFAIVLTRPEGLFVMFAAIPVLLLLKRKEIPNLGRGIAAFVGLCALLLFARMWYFHDFISHPFYIKFRGESNMGLRALFAYVWNSRTLVLLIPTLFLLPLARPLRKTWSTDALFVFCMLGLTTTWAIMGEDWKPYSRHTTPALPFLYVMIVHIVGRALNRPAMRRWALTYLLAASAFMLLLSRPIYSFVKTWGNPITTETEGLPPTRYPNRTPSMEYIGVNMHATIGTFIDQNYPKGITILYDQMGQTPWYAGLDKTFVDTLGLVNRRVGVSAFEHGNRSGGVLGVYRGLANSVHKTLWPEEQRFFTQRELIDYFFSSNAELILINEALLRNRGTPQSKILSDPRMKQRYRYRFRLNAAVRLYEHRGFSGAEPTVIPEFCDVEFLGV